MTSPSSNYKLSLSEIGIHLYNINSEPVTMNRNVFTKCHQTDWERHVHGTASVQVVHDIVSQDFATVVEPNLQKAISHE